MGFISVSDCSPEGLKTESLNTLKEYGIESSRYKGRGYNEKNVMSDVYGGLQALIKEHALFTVYIHCEVQALNLILND